MRIDDVSGPTEWSASFGGDASAVYDETLAPNMFVPWAIDLLDAVDIRPGQAVLDVACGPGTVVVLAAERAGPGGRAVGTDASESMLDIARAKTPTSPAAPLELVCGPADDLALPDATFDVITCQQGLQFFPEREAALAEMRRVSTDGGRLGFSVWCAIDECPPFAAVAGALRDVVGPDVAATYESGPWGWADPDEMTSLTEQAGYAEVHASTHQLDVHFDSPEHLLATIGASPIGAVVQALEPADHAALLAHISAGVAPFLGDRGVRAPVASTVVLAQA